VRKVDSDPHGRPDRRTPFQRKAGVYLAVAFELPSTIFGGLLVGYFLDEYFGTSPWLLILVTAVAFAGAFMRLLQWVKTFARESRGASGDHYSD
jgi:F0F1-type ATP synthase assembly protein I